MDHPGGNPTVAFIAMKRMLQHVDTADTLGLLNLLTWHGVHLIRDPDRSVLHPFTAAPVLQYATQAALLAGSDRPRPPLLTGSGLVQVIQLSHDVLNPAHLPDDTMHAMSLEELTTEFFAPLVRHQARLQHQHVFWTAAQQWQLFCQIPRSHAGVLRSRAGGDYVDIPAEVERHTGMAVEDVFTVASAVYALNMSGTHELSEAIQRLPGYLAPHAKLERFIDAARKTGQPLGATFTARELQTVLKDQTPHRARAWLNTFSARPSELKRMAERDRRYTAGEQTFQVLPLEAVPVVKLGGGRFLVPNAHSLLMGLPHLCELHALLTWPVRDRDRLRATLGVVQEIYLSEFTSEALGHRATLIPEREYSRPGTGNTVRGPDLTIVEGGSAVLVESKAMLFSDNARSGAGIASFRQTDERMTEVVVKADWKADDLLDPGVRTYDAFRGALSRVSRERVLTVIVHAEHLHGFNITWRARRRTDGHPLRDHPADFIALSLEEFTHFADVARQTGRTLYDLLRDQIGEIEKRDIGLDQSVIEGVVLDDGSVLQRQLRDFMEAVEERWTGGEG